MDKMLSHIGRIIFALPFLLFGANHIMMGDKMAGMVPSFIPGGVIWIYFTGAAMVLASLAIITGKQGRSACFGLALMLLVYIVTIHLPGLGNPQTQMMSTINLLKDMGLMGACLFMAPTFKS
ncbi:MAG TPA: DoxX family membrane protein [bacterium]|jgi:putative oxidoreductase|nr:DoxX family membrane protein [bacterium]